MKKLNALRPLNIAYLCIVAGLLLVSSCDSGFFKGNSDKESDEAIVQNKIFFDGLKELCNNDPDSAISIALVNELDFIKTGRNKELVRLYSFLSELYQYRKDDQTKALQYIISALEVYAQNPELEFDETYLYINIGNILNRYQLFDEAIYIYKQIPIICEKNLTPRINSLVYNNIALSFQSLGMCDSALSYFSESLRYIDKTTIEKPLLTIQHYNYLSALSFDCKFSDSIPYYYQKTEEIFQAMDHVFGTFKTEYYDNYQKSTKLDYYNNKISALSKIAEYNMINGNFVVAKDQYNSALNFAKNGSFSFLCTQIYLSLSKTYWLSGDKKLSMQYIDSALLVSDKEIKNFKNLQDIYISYANIYEKEGDYFQANRFKQIAVSYSDSIKIEETSDGIVLNKIELAVVPVKLAMKNIEQGKVRQKQIIGQQSYFIKLLLAVLVFIVLALLFYYRLYRNLKSTQQKLALRTIEILKGGKSNSVSIKQDDSLETGLMIKFEDEIIKAKGYLESGITLSIVVERLGSNRSYVSALINNVYGMNFNDFINKLRIEEACNIICNNTNPNFTLDHIYSEVGFAGKSTFYSSFKKYVGVTPAVFFKLNTASIDKK